MCKNLLVEVQKQNTESDASLVHLAAIAQLGERQTEDLKVLGSIPSVGTVQALVAQFGRAWV